ncbi:MAG: recombination protein RecR [Actinobacteria bacterium]|nr:recombination protein RecR [Thermoleophilia bacterium]MCB9011214.1 recombination protein RecR [Actinomycetota bacterium]
MLTPSLERLIGELSRLPGIGPRSAQRLAFHLLKGPRERPVALADALVQMAEKLRPCSRCHGFAEAELCPICADPRRDPTVLCVVEEPGAILPIERTNEFRGGYHVLGGALSPIDGVDPDDLTIDALERRIDAEGVTEVVLATNPTMTGEATALYLADLFRGRVRMTRLASGLPVGADLEHADELTLGRALLGRRDL